MTTPFSPARGFLAVLLAGIIGLACSAILAWRVNAPFEWWFDDARPLLQMELAYLAALALAWDTSLLAAGMTRRLLPFAVGNDRSPLAAWRKLGSLNRGMWPLLTVLAASWGALGTSNLTLANLTLLQHGAEWRDPLLWRIEAPIFQWLSSHPADPSWWDRLYHSAWIIELTAAFLLAALARDARNVACFCLSFVLLFYMGRLLGLLNPVMGPAFFHPEMFGHLHGSLSGAAIHLIEQVMAAPSIAQRSAVLLGGVSALPSLHVGMVALTAYWLYASTRWAAMITLPWLALVWTSTIVLGWHYALDGVGGIALAGLCIALTRRLLK